MPGFALDQIAQDIIRHAPAEAAQDFSIHLQRLIKHQGDLVVKTRSRRTDLQGQWVAVGAVQKRRLQPLGQGAGFAEWMLGASAPGRGNDGAIGSHDKQLGKVFGLSELVQQRRAVDMGKIPSQMFRQFRQVLPLLAGPVVQQLHAGVGNGFEGLFDHRVSRAIESARPTHGDFSGFAEPG